MTGNQFNTKNALVLTRMIFLAQLMGVLLFMIIVFYMGKENFTIAADFRSTFFVVLFLLTVVANPLVYTLAAKKNASVAPEEPLSIRYATWQISVIMRLAAAEAVGLFSAASILITGNLFLGLFFLVALGLMAYNYPSVSKIAREMKLTEPEIDLFYRNM